MIYNEKYTDEFETKDPVPKRDGLKVIGVLMVFLAPAALIANNDDVREATVDGVQAVVEYLPGGDSTEIQPASFPND